MAPKESPNTSPSSGTRPRLQLSAAQVLASALAAITATIAGSFLGVNGTVIGAAVASVLTVTANAIYAHSLRRTGERVRTAAPVARVRTATHLTQLGHRSTDDSSRTAEHRGSFAAAATQPLAASTAPVQSASATPTATLTLPPIAAPIAAPTVRASTRPRPFAGWRRLGIAAAMLFVTLLAVVTAAEFITGRPVSDLLRGTSGSGTTVFGASSGHPNTATTPAPQPAVTVTQTVVPKVVTTTPTVTQTAPVVTVTPTPTPTGNSGQPTQTPTPSASSTPGPTP
jgi:hypothetical protein